MRVGRRTRPKRVAGDKGYSYPFVRRMLRDRRIAPLIPTRSDQPTDPRFLVKLAFITKCMLLINQ